MQQITVFIDFQDQLNMFRTNIYNNIYLTAVGLSPGDSGF
jgi:hypothetical protein